MSRVKRSDTAAERSLRIALHRAGYRFRNSSGAGLPGTPDIVLPKHNVVLFVDGCFWHGCPDHGSTPKTNTAFWRAKILRNRARDKRVDRELRALGWKVLRIWEHDALTKPANAVRRITRSTRRR